MRIAFHSNQLSLRGTEVALFDYAHYNETILGNHSIIFTSENTPLHDEHAIRKFGARFPVFAYRDWSHAEELLREQQVELLYCIKAGFKDHVDTSVCKTAVHSVFKYCEPHGDVYAYVSEWLANHMSTPERRFRFVPHIVEPPQCKADMRGELGIPRDAIVFGRYGGRETFDIPFVQAVVDGVAKSDSSRYFLFMNTEKFCEPRRNIIFLEGSAELAVKERFIYSCDAMLHGRNSGETFGLSIAEFAVRQRPVLTWTGSLERSHIELLGPAGLYYHDPDSLALLLLGFSRMSHGNVDVYTEKFSPHRVMQMFQQVFIEG